MLNGVCTPELSASIGKCQQFFHWKTPAGAGSEIADSLTVEGNFRVPATQFADQVSHFRNAIPLIRIRAYTFLYDETTASYSYDEMLTSFLRDDRMKNRRDRAPFIGTPLGVPGVTGVIKFIPSAYVLGFL